MHRFIYAKLDPDGTYYLLNAKLIEYINKTLEDDRSDYFFISPIKRGCLLFTREKKQITTIEELEEYLNG